MKDIETIPVNLPHFKTLKFLSQKIDLWKSKAQSFLLNHDSSPKTLLIEALGFPVILEERSSLLTYVQSEELKK